MSAPRDPPDLANSIKVNDGARQADDDADENDERHAVADAALGNLLAEPHDEGDPVVRASTVMIVNDQPG